ncbi:MAG: hypothetical protein KF874_07215 [Rhizobiaceae bacterium]|nr:hypothetical protein [Rhizobiaceae bacterium]
MSILSTISYLAGEYSRARTRYQTERALRSLPFEVQKDIGWPQSEDASRPARRNTEH